MELIQKYDIPQWFPWNGSKRWLLEDLAEIFKRWGGRGKYIEPFVGGGCVSILIKNLFPNVKQYLSDANPWLISAFQSQLIDEDKISERFREIEYWRNLTDADLKRLTVCEQANRFAICLFTAWGNRWETKYDGQFRSTVNARYCMSDYLSKRLERFFKASWLSKEDVIQCADWKDAISIATEGDLVYIDPPYPESLGYGNQWWSFSDQLDVVDWVADALKRKVNVVVSNMSTIERLYKRAGMNSLIVAGPKTSKTRRNREEVIAYNV